MLARHPSAPLIAMPHLKTATTDVARLMLGRIQQLCPDGNHHGTRHIADLLAGKPPALDVDIQALASTGALSSAAM